MKQIKNNEIKLITITRSDISPGYSAVMACHSIADFAYQFPDTFENWKIESNSIICLSVKNEFELEKMYHKFKDITPTIIFYEPDVDQKTSICLYGSSQIRKKLQNLPLLLKNNNQYEKSNILC